MDLAAPLSRPEEMRKSRGDIPAGSALRMLAARTAGRGWFCEKCLCGEGNFWQAADMRGFHSAGVGGERGWGGRGVDKRKAHAGRSERRAEELGER
jgi:hypothetical protein